MLELIKATTFPFMHHRKKDYIFSLLVMLIGIASVIMKGGFQLSVDFAGGRLIEYRFNQAVSSELIRNAATSVGIAESEIQRVGEAETDYIIRVPVAEQEARAGDSPSARILEALQAATPGLTGEIRREELVGPKVGAELKAQATWAVTLSLLAILLYVAIRYEWRFAVGGVNVLRQAEERACGAQQPAADRPGQDQGPASGHQSPHLRPLALSASQSVVLGRVTEPP